MTHWIMRLVVAAAVLLSVLAGAIVGAAPAHACSEAAPFMITNDHLTADLNAANSALQRDYQAWQGDESATIEIRGVSVYESIHYVEADDDWTSGSVSVPMLLWGEWPEDTAPRMVEPQRQREYSAGECDLPAGVAFGQRRYTAVTEAYVAIDVDDGTEAALTAVFGAPDAGPRDEGLEGDLIAQINATRRSTLRIFIGGGLAALAIAGVIFYMSRTSRESPSGPAAAPA